MLKYSIAFFFSFLFFQGVGQVSSEVQKALRAAKPGEIVTLPDFLSTEFPLVDYQKTIAPGPQFIISDDPEYIRQPEAIVLQEEIQPGAVRLYVYNVNGVEKPRKMERKITALLTNKGKKTMHFRMLRYSSQKPSGNYFQIGKNGLYDFLLSKGEEEVRTIAPGETVAIDEKLEKQVTRYNDLIHGFYEFVVDQPGEVQVLQTSPENSGPEALANRPPLIPQKGVNAGRGIFPVSNYVIQNKESPIKTDRVTQLIIADGEKDPWITGTVGRERKAAQNAGNYGVMYEVELDWKSTNGKGLALVTWNSRSADNQWCGGMAMSMVLNSGEANEEVVQLPSNTLITRAAPEAIFIGSFKPSATQGKQKIRFTYSPPGASCLPNPIVLIPIDL